MGMMNDLIRLGVTFTEQTLKGHVALVPDAFLNDYKTVMTNMVPEVFEKSLNYAFRLTMKQMAHLRGVYGIEREFERYYSRLLQKEKQEFASVVDEPTDNHQRLNLNF